MALAITDIEKGDSPQFRNFDWEAVIQDSVIFKWTAHSVKYTVHFLQR